MVGLRYESASSLLKASLIWDSTILDAEFPQVFMFTWAHQTILCGAASESPSLLQVAVSSCSNSLFWCKFRLKLRTQAFLLSLENLKWHTHRFRILASEFLPISTHYIQIVKFACPPYMYYMYGPNTVLYSHCRNASKAYIWPLLCIARIYMRHIYIGRRLSTFCNGSPLLFLK
jgi:hypothetical protein